MDTEKLTHHSLQVNINLLTSLSCHNINEILSNPSHFPESIHVFIEIQLRSWTSSAREQKAKVLHSPEDRPNILFPEDKKVMAVLFEDILIWVSEAILQLFVTKSLNRKKMTLSISKRDKANADQHSDMYQVRQRMYRYICRTCWKYSVNIKKLRRSFKSFAVHMKQHYLIPIRSFPEKSILDCVLSSYFINYPTEQKVHVFN